MTSLQSHILVQICTNLTKKLNAHRKTNLLGLRLTSEKKSSKFCKTFHDFEQICLLVFCLFLGSECEVSFYWGPVRANFDSSLFWNCTFTEINCWQLVLSLKDCPVKCANFVIKVSSYLTPIWKDYRRNY